MLFYILLRLKTIDVKLNRIVKMLYYSIKKITVARSGNAWELQKQTFRCLCEWHFALILRY